jgi:hypothetical protein
MVGVPEKCSRSTPRGFSCAPSGLLVFWVGYPRFRQRLHRGLLSFRPLRGLASGSARETEVKVKFVVKPTRQTCVPEKGRAPRRLFGQASGTKRPAERARDREGVEGCRASAGGHGMPCPYLRRGGSLVGTGEGAAGRFGSGTRAGRARGPVPTGAWRVQRGRARYGWWRLAAHSGGVAGGAEQGFVYE